MNKDHRYRLIFQEFLDKTEDGFIVVDRNGIITDINANYANFLGKNIADIIGKPIGEVITNTSMYDVLEQKHRGDGSNGVYIKPYRTGETRSDSEKYAVANRFCFFNEKGELLGAAAHMKFKQRVMDTAKEVMEMELKYYRDEYAQLTETKGGFKHVIGEDPKLVELKRKGARIAQTDFPVLITGETGTGKEVIAKAIHSDSPRSEGPFICVNCGAIPDNLLESELFGYEEGAFTGAKKGGKIGKFELANHGTLFLDEIGDMPFPLQVKILRALQEHEIERVGGSNTTYVDVRVISATRRNLVQMMSEGTFREDLYYRIAVINLEAVPLRQRPGDILLYARHYLDELNKKYKTKIILSDSVEEYLIKYWWPGNVRELQNVIMSAYASCDDFMIDSTNLPSKITTHYHFDSSRKTARSRLSDTMAAYEASIIREGLKRNHYNVKATAEELGVERSLLYKKMKRLRITIERSLE